MESLIVVVSCYSKDYFLTRVCVASIKYYYPEADVYILKDSLAGEFDTTELEQAFQVKLLDLGKKEYGWGAAKIHFILSEIFNNQRVLLLDSDTVLAGRFLHELYSRNQAANFIVDAEYYSSPYEGNVPLHYYKYDDIVKYDKNFTFPGFVFNTGHLVVTPGKIKKNDTEDLFDITVFPYYKRLDILPMPDQSLLNYLLPTMDSKGLIKLAAEKIMQWSEGEEVASIDLDQLKRGNTYPYIIHWAGALRVSHLRAMTRPDILLFFEDYYYSKVPFGSAKKQVRRLISLSDFYLRNTYRTTLKPLLKRK